MKINPTLYQGFVFRGLISTDIGHKLLDRSRYSRYHGLVFAVLSSTIGKLLQQQVAHNLCHSTHNHWCCVSLGCWPWQDYSQPPANLRLGEATVPMEEQGGTGNKVKPPRKSQKVCGENSPVSFSFYPEICDLATSGTWWHDGNPETIETSIFNLSVSIDLLSLLNLV